MSTVICKEQSCAGDHYHKLISFMSQLSKKLDKFLDPSQNAAKKYKSLISITSINFLFIEFYFSLCLGSIKPEEIREAFELRSEDIIKYFYESIEYLNDKYKNSMSSLFIMSPFYS